MTLATMPARLLKKIQPEPMSGCWLWTGNLRVGGYGCVVVKQRRFLAHRHLFALAGGDVSRKVLHRCDNPGCVNPDHLFAGSQADNCRDRHRKGRTRGFCTPRR